LETSSKHPILHWDNNSSTPSDHKLIPEEPLSIHIEGKPYSVIMRTPGDELAHAAGFCLAEGIVDTLKDINTLSFCDDMDSNVVTITLEESRKEKISDLLKRRGYISQSSCGICGKEIVDELYQMIQPVSDETKVDANIAFDLLESLSLHQPLREKTLASHAAALYSENFELLSVAEDVGRHNALDKVIGKLFLGRTLHKASLLVLSSRVSYELVQKAARANIPIIFAISRPTSLAVELASNLNIALACLAQNSGLLIFSGVHRLKQ
jgi:FdhD protein